MQDYELHRYDCERLVKGSGPDGRYAGTPCTCDGAKKLDDLETYGAEEVPW
jgi:hypothetical protein